MKKAISYMIIIILIVPIFNAPDVVHAKTLGELKSELKDKENELSKNQESKRLTEQEISNTNKEIDEIKSDIEQTYVDIENLDKEIENLNQQIKEKDKQVKDIVNFVQISSGESSYLEYAFGAKSFTDFIYRLAVSEQLASYNEKLVDEYNDLIKKNEEKQVEIEQKRVDLGNQQDSLQEKVTKLGENLENIASTSISIEDEISYQKEIIEIYKNRGCKDSEDIATCGKKTLPAGTAFYRPLHSGYVTSEWGARGGGFHEGIDMSNKTYAIPVYSIGTGMVATTFHQFSCGGNMVVVHHNINGKTYTSVYAHLKSINVSKNQTVDRNTMIGTMGGGSDTEWYDGCTFGQHLHLTVATGLYGVDYTSWNQLNYTYSINPRNVINFPGLRTNWNDRVTAY